MSLTALVHQKLPEIRFVEWFRDPKFSLCYPKGPIVTMTRSQFERVGLDFVQLHFRTFEDFRLDEADASKLFDGPEDKKLLKQHLPLEINRDQETGHLLIVPCKFKQYNLGSCFPLDRELFVRASLPFTSSSEDFVRAFFEVAEEAG
jgi:hypothetical protein